jgi:hypothetical protein
MAETFIPLFSSTIRSSLWSLSGDCIKVFLTFALEAGPDGVVVASVDGIRRIVDMPLSSVKEHIATLESADEHSKDIGRGGDGRRLERVPNGWRVVNMEWYREEARRQAELFRKRKWWAEKGDAARRGARPTEMEMETERYPEMESEMDPERDLEREGSPEGSAPASPPPAAVAAPAPKKRTRKPPQPKTELPPDLCPDASCLTLARERNVSLEEEVPQFIDHHTKNASRFADWQAAIRTWIRNSKRFGGASRARQSGNHGNSDTFAHIFRKATEGE